MIHSDYLEQKPANFFCLQKSKISYYEDMVCQRHDDLKIYKVKKSSERRFCAFRLTIDKVLVFSHSQQDSDQYRTVED